MRLDKLDQNIISALAVDGRKSYREIARDQGISEAAVRQRVRKLSAEGLIRITAIGNLQALGFDVVAMVNLRVPPRRIEEYAALIAEYTAVRFVAISMGNADIIFQSLHTNIQNLHTFVRTELPAKMPDILSMEVYPLGKTLKSSWTWDAWFHLQDQQFIETGEDQ